MKVESVHRAGQLASGWLGEHTASIDWCEVSDDRGYTLVLCSQVAFTTQDNYAVTRYIAE